MMMGFGLIVPLLLIGAIAFALGWRPQINQTGPAQTNQSPEESLKARYARDEISREEYDYSKRVGYGIGLSLCQRMGLEGNDTFRVGVRAWGDNEFGGCYMRALVQPLMIGMLTDRALTTPQKGSCIESERDAVRRD